MLQPTNQAKDEFFSKYIDATIEFGRDASDKVTELPLRQGEFTGVAKRKWNVRALIKDAQAVLRVA